VVPLAMGLIRARGREALEGFLVKQLNDRYDLYSEHFADYLAEVLQDNLPEGISLSPGYETWFRWS